MLYDDIKAAKGVKLEDLNEQLLGMLVQFAKQAELREIPFIVTCTSRSQAIQEAFYAQGRLSLATVNGLRKQAGLYLLARAENSYKITWTMKSKHIPDTPGGKVSAFDVAILREGQATWNIKVNVNRNERPDYLELAEIGQMLGLRCGAFFKTPDYPHFEL